MLSSHYDGKLATFDFFNLATWRHLPKEFK